VNDSISWACIGLLDILTFFMELTIDSRSLLIFTTSSPFSKSTIYNPMILAIELVKLKEKKK